MANNSSTQGLNDDDVKIKNLLEEEDDDEPHPTENLLQINKSRDDEENGETQRAGCSKDRNEIVSYD